MPPYNSQPMRLSVASIRNSANAAFRLVRTFAHIKYRNMNIELTGSLENIRKPLSTDLVQTGHSVIIRRKAERQPAIEFLGAKAAIGFIQNALS